MSEAVNDAVDVSDLDEELISYEKAKELLLRTGELIEPRSSMPLILGGFVVGAGVGAAATYFLARRHLETKYNQIAEEEIAKMREHYLAKGLSLENTVAKPKLEDLVREQGYSSQPPMVVTPPEQVVESSKNYVEVNPDPRPKPEVKDENVFEKPQVEAEEAGDPLIDRKWDYNKEKIHRSPIKPYVIHVDEKDEGEEAYGEAVTYTYYEGDDVLCNERDEPIGKVERNELIGEANLGRFGHGSGDPSIVYIRNDRLEMQMEIVQSPNAFAEEVHGFEHSESLARNRRRGRSSPDDE